MDTTMLSLGSQSDDIDAEQLIRMFADSQSQSFNPPLTPPLFQSTPRGHQSSSDSDVPTATQPSRKRKRTPPPTPARALLPHSTHAPPATSTRAPLANLARAPPATTTRTPPVASTVAPPATSAGHNKENVSTVISKCQGNKLGKKWKLMRICGQTCLSSHLSTAVTCFMRPLKQKYIYCSVLLNSGHSPIGRDLAKLYFVFGNFEIYSHLKFKGSGFYLQSQNVRLDRNNHGCACIL